MPPGRPHGFGHHGYRRPFSYQLSSRRWYSDFPNFSPYKWLILAATLEAEAYASSDPILQERLITEAARMRAWAAEFL